jgi:hypothetical protein
MSMELFGRLCAALGISLVLTLLLLVLYQDDAQAVPQGEPIVVASPSSPNAAAAIDTP